jgi:hypothetical protein
LEAIGIAHATYAWEWLIKKSFFSGFEKQELKIYPEDEEMIEEARRRDASDHETASEVALERVGELSRKEKACSCSGDSVDSVSVPLLLPLTLPPGGC